jgi:hypothetical protein
MNVPEDSLIYCPSHTDCDIGISFEMIEIKQNHGKRKMGKMGRGEERGEERREERGEERGGKEFPPIFSIQNDQIDQIDLLDPKKSLNGDNRDEISVRRTNSKKRTRNKEIIDYPCYYEGCKSKATYITPDLLPSTLHDYSNVFQKKIRTHCKFHKTKEMRHHRSKICCICGKFGSFISSVNRSLFFCKMHRTKEMESSAYDKCIICDVKGSYIDKFKNYFCKVHSTSDMKCRWKCTFPFCNDDASYGYKYKSREYCHIHKLENMEKKIVYCRMIKKKE